MPRTAAVDEAPIRDVALVLGCAAGSAYFHDRLATAAALHAAGRVARVLASGGPEAPAMGAELVALGVPADAVVVDDRGLRTLDSMTRARDVHGLTSLLVVTHGYHLPRALLLAAGVGLDAVGVAAIEVETRRVRARTIWKNRAREGPALARAVVDLAALRVRRMLRA
jgi:SanA protein